MGIEARKRHVHVACNAGIDDYMYGSMLLWDLHICTSTMCLGQTLLECAQLPCSAVPCALLLAQVPGSSSLCLCSILSSQPEPSTP